MYIPRDKIPSNRLNIIEIQLKWISRIVNVNNNHIKMNFTRIIKLLYYINFNYKINYFSLQEFIKNEFMSEKAGSSGNWKIPRKNVFFEEVADIMLDEIKILERGGSW